MLNCRNSRLEQVKGLDVLTSQTAEACKLTCCERVGKRLCKFHVAVATLH